MRIRILGASLMLLLAGISVSRAAIEESNAFQEISTHYEAIRLALLNDEVTDVAEDAKAIEIRAGGLANQFDAREAGVPIAKAAECQALLPELSATAARLAEAEDIGAAREALFELSKPLGRYRKLAGVEGSMVVFCPMAKKAWIQPPGDIGNPYLGQEMPTCGEVVAD